MSSNERGAKFRFFSLLLLGGLAGLTSCTGLDHPTSAKLQQELFERSKHGLALARYFLEAGSDLDLRFFDGRKRVLRTPCCRHAEGRTISRNLLVVVDMASSPVRDPLRDPVGFVAALPRYGGQVVVMDMRNSIVVRSKVWIWPTEVSLSPNGQQFAFFGVPRGGLESDRGLYVAGISKEETRKVMSVAVPPERDGYRVRITVDWSPNGESLLFGNDRAVLLVDWRTGKARRIADGSAALWSPSGDWISYITSDWEAALLNVTTGESRRIDPGKKVSLPLEWSPDGKYLLISEGEGSHVLYGCLWVYRVSDGAFVPLPDYGVGGPAPHWIQL